MGFTHPLGKMKLCHFQKELIGNMTFSGKIYQIQTIIPRFLS